MKQTNKNFIFNVGYQMLMYLFPLVSSAYVSRTLGAENLGTYAYVNSIATICGMFGLLGISNYGNREVAKVRDDRGVLSTVFSSIYTLQIILSSAVLVLFSVAVIFIELDNKILYLIQIVHLLSVLFDISWLFFGLEKFKLTLTRNFVVKVVSTIFIIVFVKSEKDLWVYALIVSSSTFFSQFLLHILSKKYVDFKFVKMKDAFYHFKSCCILFVPVIAFSIYRIMDKTMIGAFSTKTQLGYYENAERLINIPIMVINALGTVMLPHMAYSIHNKSDYKKAILSSMKLALSIGTFAAFGLLVVGKDICIALFGVEYSYSGYLTMILSCTIIASAWANVIRTQYLIPKSMDKIYVLSTFIGAIVNLIFNLILIKPYGAIGACVGTILAEFSIAVFQTIYVRKQLEIWKYFKDFIVTFIKAAGTMTLIYFVGTIIENIFLRIAVQIVLAICLFCILNFKFIFGEFFGFAKKSD